MLKNKGLAGKKEAFFRCILEIRSCDSSITCTTRWGVNYS